MQDQSIRDERTEAALSLSSPAHYVSLDAMMAAAGYVSREFGHYGYRLGVVWASFGSGIFELRAGDGSTRRLDVDRYGNVELLPEAS